MTKRPSQTKKQRIRNRDNQKCQNCGQKGVELHVHHVVPLSDGGSNDPSNLTTLCVECHNAIHHDNKTAPTSDQASKPYSNPGNSWVAFVSLFIPVVLLGGGILSAFTSFSTLTAFAIVIANIFILTGIFFTLGMAIKQKSNEDSLL